MFKRLFKASEGAGGLIPKLEKVARVISFAVLVVDTLRFFHSGLAALKKDDKDTSAEVGATPGVAGSDSATAS